MRFILISISSRWSMSSKYSESMQDNLSSLNMGISSFFATPVNSFRYGNERLRLTNVTLVFNGSDISLTNGSFMFRFLRHILQSLCSLCRMMLVFFLFIALPVSWYRDWYHVHPAIPHSLGIWLPVATFQGYTVHVPIRLPVTMFKDCI